MLFKKVYQVLYKDVGDRKWQLEKEYDLEDDALDKKRLMLTVNRRKQVKIKAVEREAF